MNRAKRTKKRLLLRHYMTDYNEISIFVSIKIIQVTIYHLSHSQTFTLVPYHDATPIPVSSFSFAFPDRRGKLSPRERKAFLPRGENKDISTCNVEIKHDKEVIKLDTRIIVETSGMSIPQAIRMQPTGTEATCMSLPPLFIASEVKSWFRRLIVSHVLCCYADAIRNVFHK